MQRNFDLLLQGINFSTRIVVLKNQFSENEQMQVDLQKFDLNFGFSSSSPHFAEMNSEIIFLGTFVQTIEVQDHLAVELVKRVVKLTEMS